MGAKRRLNGTSREGTYRHTDGYRHSMTELAQWADSVKSETFKFLKNPIHGYQEKHNNQVCWQKDVARSFEFFLAGNPKTLLK